MIPRVWRSTSSGKRWIIAASAATTTPSWPYRRLSRTVSGIESTAGLVGRLSREIVPAGGTILVAGAADAGLLALAANATEGLAPTIHVADRCPTPLAVCRRYADTRGLSIVTHKLDFNRAIPPVRSDAVIADCVPQFVPREFHGDVLRRLRETMAPKSALVLGERLRTVKMSDASDRARAAAVVAALAEQDIPLPEDPVSFEQRLNRMLEAQRLRIAQCAATEDIALRMTQAGFDVWDLSKEQTVAVHGVGSVKMKIVVGSPMET